jgi:tetratricopeptide (TPR) repeat protein/transcriptional regulator with XRE-family HTH domain
MAPSRSIQSPRSPVPAERDSRAPAGHRRSPIGELVYRHRNRLNFTQLELAMRASSAIDAGLDSATVSERTVSSIEKVVAPGEPWNRPRPSTVRALAGAFDFVPGSDHYAEMIAAATLTNQYRRNTGSPEEEAPDAQAVPAAPFFAPQGRETHLNQLTSLIAGAVAGTPGVALIGAEPGTGKTSLIAEACRIAARDHSGIVTLWGECSGRLGSPDAYQPFRQILALLTGDLDSAGALQQVSPGNAAGVSARAGRGLHALAFNGPHLVERLVPGPVIRNRLAAGIADPATSDRLTDLIDSPGTTRPTAIDLNSQVERVLVAYASAGPMIVVLEDLHWSDQETATLLFHLFRRFRDQRLPIAILGSYRPSELADVPPGDEHPLTPILREIPRFYDEPLIDLSTAVGGEPGQQFVDAVIAHELGAASAGLRDLLFQRTDGLPLFVVSMLRLYRESGVLRPGEDGQFDLHGEISADTLPTEIDAVFARIIGRLPEELQRLLDIACIQGATFSAEIVMDVLCINRNALIAMLDTYLVRRYALITPAGATQVSGQRVHEYKFPHVLFRDYLYHRMSELQKHHLHLRTAEEMVGRYGSHPHEASHQIAAHFEAGGVPDRAAAAYIRAGDYAMARMDYAIARRMYHRSIEIGLAIHDSYAVAQAHVGLGNCARGEGESADAAEYFDIAQRIARRDGVDIALANSLTSRAMLDYDAGRMAAGSEQLREAVGLLLELGDHDEACRSLAFLSHTLQGQGRLDEAMEIAERAVEMARAATDPVLQMNAVNALGNSYYEMGRLADAVAYYSRSLRLALRHENLHRTAVALLNLTVAWIDLGDLDRASATSAEFAEIRKRVNRRLHGSFEYYEGLIAEAQGNLAAARRRFHASLVLRVAHNQQGQAINSVAGLLSVAVAEGRLDEVRTLVADLDSRLLHRGTEGIEFLARYYLAVVNAHLALDDRERARALAGEGVAEITARAQGIADPSDRASYLEQIPSNRRLLALARELGLESVEG